MKKRVTGLLALCMALMMVVTSTVTALADTSTIDSNDVVPFGSISTEGQVLYEGNVILPYVDNSSTSPFFVVQGTNLTNEESTTYGTNYTGIYKYLNSVTWESYAGKYIHITATNGWQKVGSVTSNELQKYKDNTSDADPTVKAFYCDFGTYQDNESGKYYYALKLPALETLFGTDYSVGYHYFAKRVVGTTETTPSEVGRAVVDANDTTGIMPVDDNYLIDTIFSKNGDVNVKNGLLLEPKPNVFTITFDANGGKIVERGEPQAVAYGLETQATESDTRTIIQLEYGDTLPEAEGLVTREGYTFAGWSTTSNGNVQFRDEAEAPALPHEDEMTLYAQWTQNTTTPSQNRHYTTTNTAESPKTGDVGLLLYGAMAVSSLMGMGYVGKKKF